jgi:hypothetical protein
VPISNAAGTALSMTNAPITSAVNHRPKGFLKKSGATSAIISLSGIPPAIGRAVWGRKIPAAGWMLFSRNSSTDGMNRSRVEKFPSWKEATDQKRRND